MASYSDEIYFDDNVKNIHFGPYKYSIVIEEISPNAIPALPSSSSFTPRPTKQTQSRPYHDCSVIDGPLFKKLIVQGSEYILWSDTSSSNDTSPSKWRPNLEIAEN